MEKDFHFSVLLDIYSGLLTEKQTEALDYYYNEDYSLAEISELMDITRQGARDFIKRGEALLISVEGRLRLGERFAALDEIRRCADEIKGMGGEAAALAERITAAADYVQNGEK